MSQAAGGGGRAEMERTLVQRSIQDDSFRQRLLDDPKAAVEQELGTQLPEGVEVRVVEESAQTIYLVLPSATAVGEGEGALRPGSRGRGRRCRRWHLGGRLQGHRGTHVTRT